MPGGKPIGDQGSSSDVRRVQGGLDAARKMFDQLSNGGKDVTPTGYPGKMVEFPNGARIGFRPVSASDGSPALDIDIPAIPQVTKIHFP